MSVRVRGVRWRVFVECRWSVRRVSVECWWSVRESVRRVREVKCGGVCGVVVWWSVHGVSVECR